MPYIVSSKRDALDLIINDLHNALVMLEIDDPDSNSMEGNLNYTITKLLTLIYTSPRYAEINDAIGVLECCKLEYYRRVAADYENLKAFQNGDVYPNAIEQEMNKK